MFISEMDDNHLQNFINLQLKAIVTIKNKLRGVTTIDPFKKALYQNFEFEDEESLTEMLTRICDLLEPYLAELALRGLDMSKELQEVFERNTKKEIESGNDEFKFLLDNFA